MNQGKVLRRLLEVGRRTTTDSPSSNDNRNTGVTSSPIPQLCRPSASQNAIYPTSTPIFCFDRSPDGQCAVLGGRYILKTVQFDGLNIKDGVDIRAAITAQQTNKAGPATTSEQLSIRDVKWTTNQDGDHTIFTACANGKIFLYDVSRLGSGMAGGTGVDFIHTGEDSRQVNKLDVNPHKNTMLLSGSQDGNVRLFDVKAPVTLRNGQATFRCLNGFKCNAEGIRDVKWSLKDGFFFACATESGAVLKWDIRKATAPLLKINAHDTLRGASSISWHPDGDHLISGGLDSKCYVWDMSATADKKQKPKYTISTPAPVTVVSWRPGLWSATAQGKRAAQVAVSYDDGGSNKRYGINTVHIWDLGRPTMPFKEIDKFDTSPSALLWHDQDLLWTAGHDGLFTQCDVTLAPKSIDRRSVSALDFSASGDVVMFLDERPQSARPRPTIIAQEMLPASSYSSSPSGQMLSISRSDSEEDVVGSFLGPRRRPGRKRRASTRSSHTLSSTPPSLPGAEEHVIPLEQAINLTGNFKPQQIMAIGHVPATSKMDIYQYMTMHYLETLEKELPYSSSGKPLNKRVADIMEHYARAAENVAQFRLAQTWRVLSYAIDLLLRRRAQYHLETRLSKWKKLKSSGIKERSDSKSNLTKLALTPHATEDGAEMPKKPQTVANVESYHSSSVRSLLAEEMVSESNVPTPLARPVTGDMSDPYQHGPAKQLTPVQDMDSFALPPALQELPGMRHRLDSTPLSVINQDSQISSTEGYDFYDLEALDKVAKAIDVPRKKEPLSLDYVGPTTPNSRRAMMARYDSDESFAQMFSISDGSRQPTNPGSYADSVRRSMVSSNAPTISNGTPEEEYQSRIRGKQIEESPDRSKRTLPKNLKRQDSGGLGEIFMISQTSAESGDSEHSQGPSQKPAQKSLESASIRLDVTRSASPRKTSSERRVWERPDENGCPSIIETDFMPWQDDPPYPFPLEAESVANQACPPLKPYNLISRALAFETKTSALNASAIILLLKPLVPEDIIDPYYATAILRQHHERLMTQKLFIEAALLRNLCVRDWPDGMEVWGDNYPSVYARAQQMQSVKVGFKCPRCQKSREIDRQKGEDVWTCEGCGSVMDPCAICGHREMTSSSLTPIPVTDPLKKGDSSQNDAILSTWWYCPGCSHGGHAVCLQGWHSPVTSPTKTSIGSTAPMALAVEDGIYPETYSDGCCPVDGCGHACLPGKWREETEAARKEELGRAVREQTRGSIAGLKNAENREDIADGYSGSAAAVIGGVRSDALEVHQSRAVEGVREALALAGIGAGNNTPERDERTGRIAGGILSVLGSSPGRGSSIGPNEGGKGEKIERERRKSVKFAGATEERR